MGDEYKGTTPLCDTLSLQVGYVPPLLPPSPVVHAPIKDIYRQLRVAETALKACWQVGNVLIGCHGSKALLLPPGVDDILKTGGAPKCLGFQSEIVQDQRLDIGQ